MPVRSKALSSVRPRPLRARTYTGTPRNLATLARVLRSGGLVLVVQELSHPAFAVGEEVKILHEKPNLITGESRTRVARVE